MNLWHLLRAQWRSGYSRVLFVMCLIALGRHPEADGLRRQLEERARVLT